MYKEAYNLLKFQYESCLKIVKDNQYCTDFANEKWRHSMQVAGAGNYLIQHIEWLKDKPESYIEMVKTAVLLHDICRFTEIVRIYNNKKKFDHGNAGANLLRNLALFMDIRIWLPIRHHGHMIEDLYNDHTFLNIEDNALQEEVKKICFIIRDADKIANLRMLAQEKEMRRLFFTKAEDDKDDGEVPELAQKQALEGKIINKEFRKTSASCLAGFLSWYTDINYHVSIDFCEKLHITQKLLNLFEDICSDSVFKLQYCAAIRKMIREKDYLS